MESTTIEKNLTTNFGVCLTMGIVTIVLGLVAMSLAVATTLASVLLLGAFIFAVGIAQLIYTFSSRQWSDALMHLLLALLYSIGGFWLVINPVAGALSVTMALVIFFFISGALRIASGLYRQNPHWGWSIFSGMVSVGLGSFILWGLPEVSLWVIGLFIGIDLLFVGVHLTALAFEIHHLTSSPNHRPTVRHA